MSIWRFIDVTEMILVTGQYDFFLISASWFVASLAIFSASFLGKLDGLRRHPELQTLWLSLAGLSVAAGIWVIGFVGMLAYSLPVAMTLDLETSILSVLPALIAAAVILQFLAFESPTFWRYQRGAVMVVLAWSAMHLCSMEAMRFASVQMAYDPVIFMISLGMNYGLALAALYALTLVSSRKLIRRLAGAVFVGLALSCMHLTTIPVSEFYLDSRMNLLGEPVTNGLIALVLLLASAVTSIFVITVGVLERRLMYLVTHQDKIISALPDGIIRVNRNLQIVYSNSAAQELFDYSELELEQLYMSRLVPSWNWGLFDSVGRAEVITAIARKKQGGKFTLEAKIASQMIDDEKQKIIVLRDVSEQKEKEQNDRRLINALEQATDGVMILSAEYGGIFRNKAMMALLQNSAEKLELSALIEQRPELTASMEKGECWHGNYEFRNRDESSTFVDVTVSPILRYEKNGQEKTLEYLLVCRDITGLKHEEAQLVAAKEKAEYTTQVKSDFLALVSQEIRTPMNGLLGLSHILADTQLDEKQRITLKQIEESGDNLLRVVTDILDFTKVEAGQLQIEDAPMSLQDLLRNIVDVFSAQKAGKSIGFEFNIEDEMPSLVYGDASRIKQVMVNLLGNAYKFTEEGQITVNVGRSHSFVPDLAIFRISVIDTGIGICEADLNRVFDAFTHGDATTTRRFAGTGLGLAISRQLVELMGGKIGASSVRGQGSVFWFELPLALVRDGEKPDEPETIITQDFQDTFVLLVEDNLVNLKVASHMLKKFGCTFETAVDGKQAVAKSRRLRFDVILMDCNMPEMDGFEATRLIRSDRSNPNRTTPVIALTARASQGTKEACLVAGMNDYCAKPIRPANLTSILNRWTRSDGAVATRKQNLSASGGSQTI